MLLSSPLTHSDWMMHADAPAWSPEGIRTMLKHCRDCGWSRILVAVNPIIRHCQPGRAE